MTPEFAYNFMWGCIGLIGIGISIYCMKGFWKLNPEKELGVKK